MKPEEIVNIILDLNSDLDVSLYENGLGYTYLTNGYVDLIRFCNWVVFNSEDDIDEAGGLRELIMQEKNKYIDMLLKVR